VGIHGAVWYCTMPVMTMTNVIITAIPPMVTGCASAPQDVFQSVVDIEVISDITGS